MLVLIDHDNVKRADRTMGIEHVVRKALHLADLGQKCPARARVRIYGGWYESSRLTRRGQSLFSEIRRCSPLRVSWTSGGAFFADVELAATTLSDPKTLIGNTFRTRGYPEGLRCEGRPWFGCLDNSQCPLGVVDSFLDQGLCSSAGCTVRPSVVFQRSEQKVVDTMMVADLIFEAQKTGGEQVVVTRDDDIWPALSIASFAASSLIHVSTADAARVPSYYASLKSPPYARVHWV